MASKQKSGLYRTKVKIGVDADGNPIYENTIQWAVLKWEWEERWA